MKRLASITLLLSILGCASSVPTPPAAEPAPAPKTTSPQPAKPTGPVVLRSGEDAAGDLVLDATHLYWTTGDVGQAGDIRRMPIAGGEVETLAANRKAPGNLVLAGDQVLWTEEEGLYRVSKSGSQLQVVVAIPSYKVSHLHVFEDAIFLGTTEGASRGAMTIWRVQLDGKKTAVVTHPDGLTTFAVDRNHFYWGNETSLWRAPRGGGGSEKLADLKHEGQAYGSTGIALHEQRVYAMAYVMLFRVAKTGGTAVLLQSGCGGECYPITAHGSRIYWGAFWPDGSAIYSVPMNGGERQVLVPRLGEPSKPIFDGDTLYWADSRLHTINKLKLP